MEQCEQSLAKGQLLQPIFLEDYALDPVAGRDLDSYLKRQRAITALPHHRLIIVEEIATGPNGSGRQLYIHAAWGRPLTRPYALAIEAASRPHYGFALKFTPETTDYPS